MKKPRVIGKCIYCLTTEPPLSEEHIVPYGFNGDFSLLEASCKQCATITSKFEGKVLRDTLAVARAAVGAKTRRPKERNQPRPMYVTKDGKEEVINVHWKDHWKVIPLPVFKPPAFLDGRSYKGGIQAERLEVTWVGESANEIAKRHNVDDVILKIHRPIDFAYAYAKLVAKIACGFAVEAFGLNGIKDAFVVPAILGEKDDIGRWVGCDRRRLLSSKKYNLWSINLEVAAGLIFVRVKLFTKANGTEYLIVVGRISEGTQGLLQSVGYRGA